ncbi:hypothetical protein, partial [Acinetobacter baumannii]|uniref:hypothetical protein n=1 Tax=Acinetobacter baumannii TaxID=470 RepID=UPI002FE0E972
SIPTSSFGFLEFKRLLFHLPYYDIDLPKKKTDRMNSCDFHTYSLDSADFQARLLAVTSHGTMAGTTRFAVLLQSS